MERLQKVIASTGYCSRRKAEELIKEGKVMVDNEIITTLGHKVLSNAEIIIEGVLLEKENKVYFLLNKPRGVISSVKDDKKRTTVVDLIDTNIRIYPVGRLDYDTTGLLILTNDGEFANILMHPSNNVEKVYMAKLKGILKKEQIDALKSGVEIDEGITVSAKRVKLKKVDLKTNTCLVQITICEGKNHQVKKMFSAVGFEVLKLKREKEGFFDLKNLQSGEFRKLTPKEVKRVYGLEENK